RSSGAKGAADFLDDEGGVAVRWTSRFAGPRLGLADTLTVRLRGALAAVEGGRIDRRRAGGGAAGRRRPALPRRPPAVCSWAARGGGGGPTEGGRAEHHLAGPRRRAGRRPPRARWCRGAASGAEEGTPGPDAARRGRDG